MALRETSGLVQSFQISRWNSGLDWRKAEGKKVRQKSSPSVAHSDTNSLRSTDGERVCFIGYLCGNGGPTGGSLGCLASLSSLSLSLSSLVFGLGLVSAKAISRTC